MKMNVRMSFAALALIVLSGAASAASPQSTELWGGPAAKGSGQLGAQFDTVIYISAVTEAVVTVDYFANIAVAPVTVTVSARGAVGVPTPEALSNAGPFFFRIRATAAVTAWSETFNRTSTGQFALSLGTFTTSEFLTPGDEANGGGADASAVAEVGRARTNVGVLCNPGSAQACLVEVAVFQNGSLLGTGTVQAAPGRAAQSTLSQLIPAAAERQLLALRLRLFTGSGQPFATKVSNTTSDGSEIRLSVVDSAFSTAPAIDSFTVSPSSGCAPQPVTLSWSTTGATRVSISGVSGELPPNGSTTVSLASTTDLVLTATSITGESSSLTRHVTVLPATSTPTLSPSSGTTAFGGFLEGIIPPLGGSITSSFVQRESTGSTFVVAGNTFRYTAGSTEGTDIIRITVNGPCGAATADFTAIVLAPGSPHITAFYAEPARGCAPASISLYWNTVDASYVQIAGVPFNQPANGVYVTTISSTTAFKLTAVGFGGQKGTSTITVPVDSAKETPILSAYQANVPVGGSFEIFLTGVSDLNAVVVQHIQQDAPGSFIQFIGPGHYIWYASGAGNDDIFWFTYRNGCGFSYAEFRGHVVVPQP